MLCVVCMECVVRVHGVHGGHGGNEELSKTHNVQVFAWPLHACPIHHHNFFDPHIHPQVCAPLGML